MGLRKMQDTSPLFKHVSEEHDGNTNIRFEMKTIKKHFTAFSRLVHESVVIERTSKANDFNILNSKGEWGRSHLPRLRIDESHSELKEDLMKKNNFSKNEKDWNVAQSKNMKVEAKRKASSEKTTDDDKEPLSSKKLVTFSFSKDDIEGSTKAATKSENNGREPKSKKTVRHLQISGCKRKF